MGTRGAIGFRQDGADKLTYNHFDSYPEHLGEIVVDFIKQCTDAELAQIASGIILVEEGKKPTYMQIKECQEFTDLSVSERSDQDWYCLLRGAQGNLLAYKEGLRYMIDSKGFMKDSLFCEYAYVINIDDGNLEFYRGFNKNPKAAGRYAEKDDIPEDGYAGVKLVSVYPFSRVRDTSTEDLVADMIAQTKDEEE